MTRDDPAAFAPPPSFGPFRVLHQIGIGALGPVFRTYEPTRDRLVAVKVFRLDITPEQSQALADELARAGDAGLFHPSIVEPLAAGVEGTVAYRAEEYVAGESMDVAIRHYAPASLEKALPFITQLAGAIDFARAAGVGHGALHLRDIFVTPDEARASGFGVVDALDRLGIRAPVRRPYTAPERIAGEPWGTPADVFSLAAVAYELLTGRRPAGTGDQIGPWTGDTGGDRAAAIHGVLARAMDDDPGHRYQSALGFASALEAAALGEHVTDALRDVSAIAAVPVAGPAIELVEPVTPRESAPALEAKTVEVIDVEVIDENTFDAEAVDDEVPPERDGLDDEDISAERNADQAHYDLLVEEAEDTPAPAPALFDDEAAADLALDVPETDRFADEFTLADDALADADQRARVADREAVVERAAQPSSFDHHGDNEMREPSPADVVTAERSHPAMLPLAITGILCLLLGFAAGYAVGGRDRPSGAPQAAAPAPETPAPASPQAATIAPAPGRGQEFSEQAITPPRGAGAAPPTTVPPVPGDSPSPPGISTAARQGTIVIRSTPSRAGVTVNGTWRGRTPLTLEAQAFGPYSVRVVEPGYAVARQEFTLSAADPARTLSFRLERSGSATPSRAPAPPASRPAPPERAATLSGAIYVDSRPRGAAILIDGKRVGTTPALIAEVEIGSHVVRLELSDHRPWTSSTRVAAGQETRVTGSLERIR